MNFNNVLGKVGLTTRGELAQAQAKKEIWHNLVRDVFARYYLKLREAFPDQLPDLPRKYSTGWENHIKAELDNFLSTDLQDVDPLLRACGFGTEKWQQFVEETLPEMDTIVDSHLSGELNPYGHAPDTDEELAQELREARKEIRQLRSAGRKTLSRLKDYERQIEELRRRNGRAHPAANDNGVPFVELFPNYASDDYEAAGDDGEANDLFAELSSAAAAAKAEAAADGDNGNPADPEPSADNPADLFAPADDDSPADLFAAPPAPAAAKAEAAADGDDNPADLFAAAPQTTGSEPSADNPADLFAPAELPPAAPSRRQETPAQPDDEEWVELQRQNQELRSKLALSDKKIEALSNQLEDLEEDIRIVPRAERLNTDDDDDLRPDGDNEQELFELQRRNEHLQRDINAKDHTIDVLRGRIEEMERQMGAARDQLLAEVKKLDELTSGELELKPSEELDGMQADELLEYAQAVAGDLDVRRQTLDEGLKGVTALQENYEESRQQHEQQQQMLETQLEKMAADLEDYQQKMSEAETAAAAAAERARQAEEAGESVPQDHGEAAELVKVVATQRDQLLLLSERIKELQNSNKELQSANHKMYKDLDTAVKRIVPLRGQIEELENLRDALSSYIRNKYDRTFTVSKIQDSPQ